MNAQGYDIYLLIEEFFENHPDGTVTLAYPNAELNWDKNIVGISFKKGTFDNIHKMKWREQGVFVLQTMGYSLVTGKHLYIPYHQITSVTFYEEGLC